MVVWLGCCFTTPAFYEPDGDPEAHGNALEIDMRDEALFVNGVYRQVLEDILTIQSQLPDQILFLQPYSAQLIRHLHEDPPSIESAMDLYISPTDMLGEIQFRAQIVGIDDKRNLSFERRKVIGRVISVFQPTEGGVYLEIKGHEAVNLLHVRRMTLVNPPVPVTKLVKTKDSEPIAGDRTTSGGWAYVRPI